MKLKLVLAGLIVFVMAVVLPLNNNIYAVTCTDSDADGFAIEGGDCGPVDCDDNNPAINPDALELCDDGIDNDCNGAMDDDDLCAEL